MFELFIIILLLGLIGFVAYQSHVIGKKHYLEDELKSIQDGKKIKERVENDPTYREKIRNLFTRLTDSD